VNVPRFSVVTPVHDPPVRVLRDCAESVFAQTTGAWQWCVVDDGSTDPDVRRLLAELGNHRKVTLTVRETSGGIVAASNAGVETAKGKFVVLLDHDDMLHPEALARIDALADDTVDLLYTDEDVLAADGKVLDPMVKPGWSPERLRAHNYVNHVVAVRTSLLRELGGFRAGLDGSQDHDLVLRVSERARTILHVPAVLYRWRSAPGSVLDGGLGAKPGAWEAGRRAVAEHCARVGIDAEVGELEVPGIARWYRVHRRVPAGASIAVIVPVLAADLATGPDGAEGVGNDPVEPDTGSERLRRTVGTLVDADPIATEVLLVGAPDCPLAALEAAAAECRATGRQATALTAPRGRGRGALRNWGAAVTDAEYLAFLDPTVTPSEGWLTELVGLCTDQQVGAAGARLVGTGDVLEQAGYGLVDGVPEHLLRGLPANTTAYTAAALVPGERSAVSAACMAVRRDVFAYVGGFSDRFDARYEDVDLCLKLRGLHRRVIYTPFATGVTRERTAPHVEHAEDLERLRERWSPQLNNDPYLNPAVRSAEWLTVRA
jgi:GT2 family glycosyltransferase